MNRKGLNATPALLKFLVPLAIFLSANNANAFKSLSSLAGNHVRVNHLIQLQQPMSDSTNESSREPIHKPTKRLGQDALLPVNLSSKGGLCHDKKSERVMFSNQGQDNEIKSKHVTAFGIGRPAYSVRYFILRPAHGAENWNCSSLGHYSVNWVFHFPCLVFCS